MLLKKRQKQQPEVNKIFNNTYFEEHLWTTVSERIKIFPISNHIEADTRLIIYARINNEAALNVVKDTDVFSTSNLCFRSIRMFSTTVIITIDSNKLINVNIMIYNSLGGEILILFSKFILSVVLRPCYMLHIERSMFLKSLRRSLQYHFD